MLVFKIYCLIQFGTLKSSEHTFMSKNSNHNFRSNHNNHNLNNSHSSNNKSHIKSHNNKNSTKSNNNNQRNDSNSKPLCNYCGKYDHVANNYFKKKNDKKPINNNN